MYIYTHTTFIHLQIHETSSKHCSTSILQLYNIWKVNEHDSNLHERTTKWIQPLRLLICSNRFELFLFHISSYFAQTKHFHRDFHQLKKPTTNQQQLLSGDFFQSKRLSSTPWIVRHNGEAMPRTPDEFGHFFRSAFNRKGLEET